jgi:hypothetical protein
MAKLTREQLQGAISAASRYAPGETAPQKEPLMRRLKMAALGKRYKTPAAKKMKKRKEELDASMPSYRTQHLKRQARERYGTKI